MAAQIIGPTRSRTGHRVLDPWWRQGLGQVDAAIRLLVPSRCPVCGQVGSAPCGACSAMVLRTRSVAVPDGVDALVAIGSYQGALREMLIALKVKRRRDLAPWLGCCLVARARADLDPGVLHAQRMCVAWIPSAPHKLRRRGFDHGKLLAGQVALELGVTRPTLLARSPGPQQTGANRSERLVGPALGLGPQARPSVVAGATVVLVDDIMTTGASLSTGARLLRRAGVKSVIALVGAVTPDSERTAMARTAPVSLVPSSYGGQHQYQASRTDTPARGLHPPKGLST